MKTRFATRLAGWTLITLLVGAPALAVSLDILMGQTRVVTAGQVYDAATVRNGGVLILDGGTISNVVPALSLPSVIVDAGGRFIFNAGYIHYFENRGSTELYGGTQSGYSSENYGYVKYAGGDPGPGGSQLVHLDGRVDVYYVPTNRVLWEINVVSASLDSSVHLYTFTNTLAAGSYKYSGLPTSVTNSQGKEYWDRVAYWTPGAILPNRQITLNMDSDWPGKVWVYNYIPLPAYTSSARTAIEVNWNAVSGHTYQVQCTTDLVNGVWKDVGLPVNSDSSTGSVFDTTRETNKMYRVLLRH